MLVAGPMTPGGEMRRFLISVFFLLLAVPAHAADGDEGMPWFKESFLDIREDIAEAKKANRRLMLYFYQDGCPYCAKLIRDNFGQKSIADKTRKHFDVIALNLWGDREVTDLAGKTMPEKEFARATKVQFTPTLVMFDEQGEVALRLNGYLPPHKFEAAVDYVGQRLEKKQSFADYLAKHAREPASATLNEAPWLLPAPLKLADTLKRGGRPMIVLFEQKECAACDEMHLEAFPRPEVKELLGKFDIARIDMASREPVQTPDGKTGRAASASSIRRASCSSTGPARKPSASRAICGPSISAPRWSTSPPGRTRNSPSSSASSRRARRPGGRRASVWNS